MTCHSMMNSTTISNVFLRGCGRNRKKGSQSPVREQNRQKCSHLCHIRMHTRLADTLPQKLLFEICSMASYSSSLYACATEECNNRVVGSH